MLAVLAALMYMTEAKLTTMVPISLLSRTSLRRVVSPEWSIDFVEFAYEETLL